MCLGSKKTGSSLNLVVNPSKSFVPSNSKNFGYEKAAMTNSLLRFKISILDLNL